MKLCKLEYIDPFSNNFNLFESEILSGNILNISGVFNQSQVLGTVQVTVTVPIETITVTFKLLQTNLFTNFKCTGLTNLYVPVNDTIIYGTSDQITLSFTSNELIYGSIYTFNFDGN